MIRMFSRSSGILRRWTDLASAWRNARDALYPFRPSAGGRRLAREPIRDRNDSLFDPDACPIRMQLALHDEPDGIGKPLRRVRYMGRQPQHVALAAGNIHAPPVLDRPQQHVAFELVEELLARVVVVVLAGVRAADHHDDELTLFEYLLVADGRAQVGPVRVDPLPEVERCQRLHGPSIN